MFVFLPFLPVFTVVTSWIVLILHTSLLPFHTCTITSPLLRNTDCPFFKHLPSPSRSLKCPFQPSQCRRLSCFCLAKFELISHCYKNCLNRCNDFGLSFSLKVITLCPPTSFFQLSMSPCCRYNPIPPYTPFLPALHILLFSLDGTS